MQSLRAVPRSPLLITPEASPLPTLDPTRLLAHEAVTAAIAGRVPVWRGGPVRRGSLFLVTT